MSLSVTIHPDTFRLFPRITVQWLRVSNYGSAISRTDPFDLYAQVSRHVNDNGDALLDARSWRPIFQQMGLKPSKFLSSIEALTIRARKARDAWRTGIVVIDFYNAISILHGAPLGGYDLDRLESRAVSVRPARRETDRFIPVGGQVDIAKGNDALLVYAAGDDVMCWALNHRDSVNFGLRNETRQAVFFSEAMNDAQAEAASAALCHLSQALKACGACTVEIGTTQGASDKEPVR